MSDFADKLEDHPARRSHIRSGHAMRFTGREFLRLVWKELLTLRPFFCVVAVVTFSVSVGLSAWQPDISAETRLLLLSLPQWVSIVFSIGVGTLLFSQETELGTLDFLRGMGVSPRRVVNAKLLAGGMSLVTLVAAVSCVSWQPALSSELPISRMMLGLLGCGVGLAVLHWTSLWSMTIRRELPTVCGGLGGALLLKPFVDQWTETGLLTFLGVATFGLWLLCQVAASHWMSADDRWWLFGRRLTPNQLATPSADEERDQASVCAVASNRDATIIGSTVTMGVGLWIILMICAPQSARAGRWPDTLEMVWSMLVGAMLGWWPMRTVSHDRGVRLRPLNHWLHSVPWLLVWWLLSMGLWCAYRAVDSFELAFSSSLHTFRTEVLPWSIVTFAAFRWSAQICSANWWTWLLAIFPLSCSWCVWWLLATFREPAWLGLLLMALLLEGASWWHWQAIRRDRSLRRTNLCAIGGTVGVLVASWGLLNAWRVAEVPVDWTGGLSPAPLPALSDAEARERSQQCAELVSLMADIQDAPTVTWPDGREVQCFHNDWPVIDGQATWSDVTEPTRRWVESHEGLIAAALHDNAASRPATSVEVAWPKQPVVMQFQRLMNLAARRCEQLDQLDDAWRLQQLAVLASLVQDQPVPSRNTVSAFEEFWSYHRLGTWVAHPQQSSERIKRAIVAVLANGGRVQLPEVTLARRFAQVRSAHREFAENDCTTDGGWSWERWLFRRLCPSEQRREERILDGLEAAYRMALTSLRPVPKDVSATWMPPKFELAISAPQPRPFWLLPSVCKVSGSGTKWVRGAAVADLMVQTPRLQFPQETPTIRWNDFEGQFLNTERQRREFLLSLALRAFELDHHRAATSARELVPDYLPQQPVDVTSGRDLWTLRQEQTLLQEQAAGQFPFSQ